MVWDDDIFDEIDRMRTRLNHFMKRFWESAAISGKAIGEELESFGSFPIDIAETEDEVIVKANLPGFDKTDIAIRSTGNTVEIAAQHKEKKIEKTEKMFRAERKFGAMRRFLTLPTEVKVDTVKTTFEKGILEIRFKKAKPVKKAKEIKVE